MPSETRGSSAVEALLKEKRKFAPPKDFVKHANVNRASIYRDAAKNPARFWERFARELDWFKPWKTTLQWKAPNAKWFVGGKLNVSYNCLDRHVATARKTKAAIIWEGEPGDARVLTYWDLHREVNRFAAALKRRGVKKGDRVTIYMPMVPELPIAMLACARIGAPHTVVFGGFSAEALRDRVEDCKAKLDIALGDARLSLEREPSQQFDVLAVDAFSGDAIPLHLLTTEAFAMYKKHLKPDGIIVCNITNTYLDLWPVIKRLADEHGFKTARIYRPTENQSLVERTYFAMLTNDQGFLGPVMRAARERLRDQLKDPDEPAGEIPQVLIRMPANFQKKRDIPLWTDRYHNLFQVLR